MELSAGLSGEESIMSEAEYDVVIVGAGVTGALVAKTLVDKGGDRIQKILILDGSPDC